MSGAPAVARVPSRHAIELDLCRDGRRCKLARIDLIPIAIDAADMAPVAIGTALLAISKYERDGAIEFGFTVYAVQEKGEWRWKSIQFACDQVPERD